MLNIEQVKQIAEHMGVKTESVGGKLLTLSNKGFSLGFDAQYGVEFSPCEDTINHQVFKALVDECKDQKVIFIDSVEGKKLEFGPLYIETGEGKLNENICLAFLNKMDGK